MQRKALTNKIIVLGVDGMDPRLTKKYLDKGVMPNLAKYVKKGSSRDDLVLLGGMPTITPPMWTTLSTGAYPNTHGITCFWSQHPTKIDTFVYANDSRNCKAEHLWNVFVEAGKKTLVWHWPGTSWPPTSDSPLLHVVEGTQPSSINFGIGQFDWEQFIEADAATQKEQNTEIEVSDSGAGCVMTDMEVEETEDTMSSIQGKEARPILMKENEGECQAHGKPPFFNSVPITEATGWSNAPEGAKEFVYYTCDGKVRRPCLILKNTDGKYDRVAVYKSKKDLEPIVVLHEKEYKADIVDEVLVKGEKKIGTRSYIAYDISEDGSKANLWVGGSMDMECDTLFSPKSLYKEVVENVGYVKSIDLVLNPGKRADFIQEVMLKSWRYYGDWQAAAMNHLIKTHGYEVVFSHYHNLDNFGHVWYEQANQYGQDQELENEFERLMEMAYVDTDRYLGDFLHLLDDGWTVIITSDHGLLCKEKEYIQPALGDGFGVNTKILRELGYTVMVRDKNGKETREIDWTKTTATAPRGNHIYLSLKGRNENGIVDPSERYELEKKIISDLYNYRYHGERVVSIAMRNKEAAVIGMSGPECGDIIYFLEEGVNRMHGDSMSTYWGHADTSVSPIFIAAGTGVKKNYKTDRVIRQVDVTPTMAVLGGVRMPAQCEGAPVYQILEEEY
ncbi:alkaline phosphatase family protein [Desulfitobacterium sp. THU1]|uniref:alkaline phosphatase family protein n=1 Tax=Desulfitobacterium sp. THU1 TaxID=3138072 RepID=UPI00311EEE1E